MRVKAIALVLFAFLSLPLAARADIVIGKPAPALSGKLVNGKKFDLADQRGKVVVVNFWARWCAPCREEMPALDSLYRHNKKNLVVIGVSMDHHRYRDEVTKIAKGVSYPSATFADMKTNDFGWPDALPMTYVVDKNGLLAAQVPSSMVPIKEAEMEKMLKPLMTNQHIVDKNK